ncbi:hypothetical protein, partial [Xanthomonas nasturtii]
GRGILEPGAPVAADLWCLKGVFQGRPVIPTVRMSSARPVLASNSSKKLLLEKSSQSIAIDTEATNSAPRLDVMDFSQRYPSEKLNHSAHIRSITPPIKTIDDTT